MHEFVNCNQNIRRAAEVSIVAASAAALVGKSVFTTVAVYDYEPFQWEKHWARLIFAASRVGIDFADWTKATIENALRALIEKNDVRHGRARLTFFDCSPSAVWQPAAPPQKNVFLIQTADFRPIENPLKLTVSEYPVNSKSPLNGIKSGNYLENILAWEAARRWNFDEAIRLNEHGEIVAACLANVFWQKNDALFTASLETGCLAGTTRAFLLENREVTEKKARLDELIAADEIFLTSAGIGIAPAILTI